MSFWFLKRTGKSKKCLFAVVLFYKQMSDNSLINYIQSMKTILPRKMISNVASLKVFLYGTYTYTNFVWPTGHSTIEIIFYGLMYCNFNTGLVNINCPFSMYNLTRKSNLKKKYKFGKNWTILQKRPLKIATLYSKHFGYIFWVKWLLHIKFWNRIHFF